MNAITERLKRIVIRRQQAYQMVFERKSVYAELVLKDLSRFCRANESAFHEDPRANAVLEGRREVWLRIQKYSKLTQDELWELYRKDIE